MPEENRVFDVAKPGQSSPSATSKPIIVGHHPAMSDPMVRDDSAVGSNNSTHIQIRDDDDTFEHVGESSNSEHDHETSHETSDAGLFADSPAFGSENQHSSADDKSLFDSPVDSSHDPKPVDDNNDQPIFPEQKDEDIQPIGRVEELRVSPPKRKKWPIVVLILLVLGIGAYLAVDSGAVGSGINLPYHFFKQKTQTAATTPTPATKTTVATSLLPAGFTKYKLEGTQLTFAAPTAWGKPTSATDAGFSARGGSNKADGVYAYLVAFETNKDIQIAVTSAKYLPPARTALYYDFLQWCTGTNDGKIYLGVMRFTTTNKIDTPSTITCDQGPMPAPTKLDSTTVVELKSKDGAGKVVGDLYTKNIDNKELVVFRVKDAAMTNSVDIKKMLLTINIPQNATTSAASGASQ